MAETSFPLEAGNSGKDVTGVSVVIISTVGVDETSYSIVLRKSGQTDKDVCPPHCPTAAGLLTLSNLTFTLSANEEDYQVLATGLSVQGVCPSPCPLGEFFT